jgi:hypothetical protein
MSEHADNKIAQRSPTAETLSAQGRVHSPTLSVKEEERLRSLEAIVGKGLQTFIEVGTALAEIRAAKLYRGDYGTFEEYCRLRWAMSRIHAHRLIEATGVVENLLPAGNKLPMHERQVRPLTVLEPEQQRQAWRLALEASPTPTADDVERAVQVIAGDKPGNVISESEEPQEDDQQRVGFTMRFESRIKRKPLGVLARMRAEYVARVCLYVDEQCPPRSTPRAGNIFAGGMRPDQGCLSTTL